ncbi:unnamed protein product [Caenorhabditis nigoni]
MNKKFDKASEITQFLKGLPGIQVELPILHEFWRIKMVEFNEQRRIARQKYEREQARESVRFGSQFKQEMRRKRQKKERLRSHQ